MDIIDATKFLKFIPLDIICDNLNPEATNKNSQTS